MLATERLQKHFSGTIAVDDLTLSVKPGELFALLGPNGAGKTTTINCFLGFVTPDAGRVLVDGMDVGADPRSAQQRVAYIPEQVNLYGDFSGRENLAYFSELAGHRYAARELREFLSEAGLETAAQDRRVSTYSKGMRQKVGIAIALAKQAGALLLDEPTSGLDPSAAHEFSRLLRQLRERGMAILMATHDLFRAKEDATRVGIMRHGRLVRELTSGEISHADLERLYLESMQDGGPGTA